MICVFMICLIICLFIGQMYHENVYIIMIIFLPQVHSII